RQRPPQPARRDWCVDDDVPPFPPTFCTRRLLLMRLFQRFLRHCTSFSLKYNISNCGCCHRFPSFSRLPCVAHSASCSPRRFPHPLAVLFVADAIRTTPAAAAAAAAAPSPPLLL
ncbi:unnamed protein product, partial [Phaeothamnion confervicola]